ncbi:MAG: TlpA family protein disulfide reductase [Crocinitomicaceae bacterium]|nr:TlpA family protein disulfide reductase [Crocinitomicaceae bacterium]
MKKYWKKYKNLLFYGILLTILFVPAIRFPVQVFLQNLLSFSPSSIAVEERAVLMDYDYQLLDLSGKYFNLKAFQDQVIVINYWATWCPPCVAEMPAFQKLYNDYKDDVAFFFVSNDPLDKVTAFANKKNLQLPFFQPQSNEPLDLRYTALPTTFVLSKTGEIAVRTEGAANWNSKSFRALLDVLK